MNVALLKGCSNALAACATVVTLSLALSAVSTAYAAAGPVATAQGMVQGLTAGPVETFFGVPFATPPLGDRRWRAPLPPQPYPGGTLQASSFAPPCYQGGAATPTVPAPSEDCLYLNI